MHMRMHGQQQPATARGSEQPSETASGRRSDSKQQQAASAAAAAMQEVAPDLQSGPARRACIEHTQETHDENNNKHSAYMQACTIHKRQRERDEMTQLAALLINAAAGSAVPLVVGGWMLKPAALQMSGWPSQGT